MPSSIVESERTLAERERILAEAEAERNRIIAQARQKANEMLSADALVAMARREAQRIQEDGHVSARQQADQADSYTAEVLEDLAARLSHWTKEVDSGLTWLKDRREARRQALAASAPQAENPAAKAPSPPVGEEPRSTRREVRG